ncbi:MAG: hypothetical protein IJV15_08290 [Lachnospiraceae bacterium]|nr:hypothetical protein [Lachnospiraceae bacterium]
MDNNTANFKGNNVDYSNTFDDVFQSLKSNHPKYFIPLINYKFQKNYSLNEAIELLPADEYITGYSEEESRHEIEKRITDFIIKIRDDKYLIECQSYNDGSIALRIVEYSFLNARQDAKKDNGRLIIEMPYYTVIYIRSNSATPKRTEITYKFPNGEAVKYDADNLILSDFTKEEIIEKKLYVLIPFYMLRYESIMKDENAAIEEINEVENDIDFFIKFLADSFHKESISGYDYNNFIIYMDMIIRHVTNGNENERNLVKNMGGHVIVTEADKIFWAGKDEGRAESAEIIAEQNNTIAELTKQIEELKAELNRS